MKSRSLYTIPFLKRLTYDEWSYVMKNPKTIEDYLEHNLKKFTPATSSLIEFLLQLDYQIFGDILLADNGQENNPLIEKLKTAIKNNTKDDCIKIISKIMQNINSKFISKNSNNIDVNKTLIVNELFIFLASKIPAITNAVRNFAEAEANLSESSDEETSIPMLNSNLPKKSAEFSSVKGSHYQVAAQDKKTYISQKIFNSSTPKFFANNKNKPNSYSPNTVAVTDLAGNKVHKNQQPAPVINRSKLQISSSALNSEQQQCKQIINQTKQEEAKVSHFYHSTKHLAPKKIQPKVQIQATQSMQAQTPQVVMSGPVEKPFNYREVNFNLLELGNINIVGMARPNYKGMDVNKGLRYVKNQGYDVIIGLNDKYNLTQSAFKNGLKYYYVPMKDFNSTPIKPADLNYIYETIILESPNKIAIHCGAGTGRTGTVLASLKLREKLEQQWLVNSDYELFKEVGLKNVEIMYTLCTGVVADTINSIRAFDPMPGDASIENCNDVNTLSEYEVYLRKNWLQFYSPVVYSENVPCETEDATTLSCLFGKAA